MGYEPTVNSSEREEWLKALGRYLVSAEGDFDELLSNLQERGILGKPVETEEEQNTSK